MKLCADVRVRYIIIQRRTLLHDYCVKFCANVRVRYIIIQRRTLLHDQCVKFFANVRARYIVIQRRNLEVCLSVSARLRVTTFTLAWF